MRAQLHTREMRDMNVKAPDPAAPQHRVLSVFAALQRWCGEHQDQGLWTRPWSNILRLILPF